MPASSSKNISPMWIIFAISFISAHGVPGLVGVLPDIAKTFGVSTSVMGLSTSSFALACLFFSPLTGFLADRISRAYILIPSVALYCGAGFMCATAQSLEAFLAFRFLQGIGATALTVLPPTLVTDFYTGEERAKIMGYSFAALCVGLLFFPAISGIIGKFSWRMSIVFLHLPSLIVLYMTLKMPRIHKKQQTSSSQVLHIIMDTLKKKEVLYILTIGMLIMGIDMGLQTYYPFFLAEKFGASSSAIGVIYSFSTLGMVLGSSLLMPRFFSKPIFPAILLITGVISVFSIASFTWQTTVFAAACMLLLYYIFSGLLNPFINMLMSLHASPETRASLMAVLSLSLRVGQTIIPLSMGWLLNVSGFTALFIFSGFLLALATVVSYMLSKTNAG